MFEHIDTQLTDKFMDRLLSTKAGRAHVLNQAAEAEDSDEGVFFTELLSKVDDPQLQKMIRRHEADEKRHAAMFREAVERQGVTPGPVPESLRMIDNIDRALGGFFEEPIVDDEGVMNAYLLLQVIEERAATQFAMFEPVMRKYDPESADVLASIAKDEERHLKYCRAISRRYAPDEKTRVAQLQKYREVEARVFAQNSATNLNYALDHGLVKSGRLERMGWRLLAKVTVAGDRLDKTPFWNEAARPETECFKPDSVAAIVAMSPHAA